MIKIERMSPDCVAKIEGEPVFIGALISMYQLGRLVVSKGELMYTINEREIWYRTSEGDSERSSNVEVEVPQVPDSAKPTQNLDSAKPTQNLDSAKPTQNLDSAKPTK